MIPSKFEQSNKVFVPPTDLDPEQCQPIHAYLGAVQGGSCDGVALVVTAWTPTPQELADLNAGNPVFLSCVGGLPPHFLTTRFEQAIKPA